eukprot:c16859_g2_i1 orf=136-576(+)
MSLEVILESAHGLKSADCFSKTDPYVLLSYSTQILRSKTVKNHGNDPIWNEKFLFTVDEGVSELILKIMDEDLFTADDHLGTAKIPLKGVLSTGKLPPTAFNVVRPDGHYQGEVKVALTYSPKKLQSYSTGLYQPQKDPSGSVHGE